MSPAKDLRFLKFRELYFELKQEYGKNFDKFFSLDEGYLIPCSIFNKQLSSFESIVKYLVENCGLKIAFISKIFNRTNKTIWQAYRSSKEKLPKKFTDLSSKFWIPASLFSDRKLSVLEHITIYLKTSYSMSFKEIAKILLRDITTVRTVYYRGRKKGGNK
ncbi:sigma-70 region 4 domain-containing protein [Candidatus Woesearchaeota archaeon]|nr:sigma-70 region 4 domain-containing protein [Candidatus Woesearchaeota archaeon]